MLEKTRIDANCKGMHEKRKEDENEGGTKRLHSLQYPEHNGHTAVIAGLDRERHASRARARVTPCVYVYVPTAG